MSDRSFAVAAMMVQAFIIFATSKTKEGYSADVLGRSLIMAGISVSIRTVGVSALAAWLQGQVDYLRTLEAAESQETQKQPLSTSKAA